MNGKIKINKKYLCTNNFIRLGIDHQWLFGPLALLSSLVALMPLPPNDFWWHLKIGELIYTGGTVPSTNLFAWSLSRDAPFTYGAWLGETLLYVVYRLGGLPLALFSRNVLALTAFFLVGVEARRRSGSWRIAGPLATLALLMTFNNLVVRPQIWAFLPFMLLLILLGAYAQGQLQGRWLLLLPLMMVFWVNVHGTFILGFFLMGITLAGEGLRVLIKQPGALAWRELGWLAAILLICLLAMLLNPQGWGIFGYVYNLMTDQPSQGLIMEWQTPAPQGLPAVLFYSSILLLMATWALSARKPSPTDLLLVLAFTWLAWNGVRYVIWYALVAMPVLAGAIKELLGERKWLAPAPRNLLNLVLAILLFVPFILVQPWWIGRMPLPETYQEQVLLDTPEGPLLTVHTPVGAAEYLRENPGGKLFNEMGYGSYLIWALPEQGVFIDPRVELYPYEMWQDYIRITRGARYNELLEAYGADRLLLDRELQAELITTLEGDAGWEREYEDAYAQVWRKVEGR
jgi:hypothetical protein